MKVSDILKIKGHAVETVHSWTPVTEAIRRLAGPPQIGALVVCDGEGRGRVEGLLTERDLIKALHRAGPAVLERSVGDLMHRHVPVCAPDDSLAHLMAEMTHTRQRHLPVVRDGVLCGLVSIGDVVRHRLDEMRLEADVLRDMYLAHR
ncbi:CBS domain-containing protein [Pseudonocardia sp. GCM10023141]|uniref:CBS domain-containing protein n=1 Tax=Pseudonocardia sp. GCM10023141 TaxID=3252653 RepID=UPI00361A22FA